MRPFRSIAIVLLVLAGGCAVGPHYQPPKTKTPPAFGELNPSVNTNTPVAQWWTAFHDAELSHLITGALQSNYDLQIALMRIRESRYQRNIAAADLFPTVDADASYAHARGSKNVVLPLGGSGGSPGGGSGGASGSRKRNTATTQASGGSVGPNPFENPPSPFGQGGLPGATTDLYQMGFDASWEIDVFGGKRRQVEAAAAEVGAAAESRHALQVSLAAETARDYMELRATQLRLRVARENLATQKDVLALTVSKRNSGLATDIDVVRAGAEVSATESTLEPLQADERRIDHALAILIGREPNELNAELAPFQPLPATPPEVPVGLPSQLLQRRADIREAEREIAAANARIGVATADLFPKFALVGSLGLDATQPGNLVDWSSRYFLISPSVTWRIFDAGRIMSNIRLQRANEEEAALQYRGTILKALQEVEDALVNYASERIRRNHLADEFKQDQESLELARQRYAHGLSDFLEVLDAERDALSAEDTLTVSELTISTDLVALYKSLGGGWN